MNHGFSPEAYLAGLPADRVGQIHPARHGDMGAYLFDTHDGPVIDAVWDLYRSALRRFGRVSTFRAGLGQPGQPALDAREARPIAAGLT